MLRRQTSGGGNVTTLSEHPFSTDRPIGSAADDLLGRAPFAQSLARAIGAWTLRDSLVIGLFGPWGEGKTSVKNMTLESLRKTLPAVTVVEFNPWQWSGQDQLASAFFDQIGLALGRTDKGLEGRRRTAKWRAYAAYLRAGSLLVSGIPRFLFPLLLLFGSVGLLGAGLGSLAGVLRILFGLAGAILLLVAALLSQGGKFAEFISSGIAAQVEAAQKSLDEVRKELTELLAKLKEPLVVVIDDVDRLDKKELQLLFQLVKANADFPSLVYLMLFQRNTVEKGLHEISGGSGRDFLEKIIQVGFDVPIAERGLLERAVFDGLNRILADPAVEKRFNQRRWANLFVPGISGYFRTLRDVRRFLAVLDFHLNLFLQDKSLEIDPIDLIGLEALRVFEPDVYSGIPPLKAVVTRLSGTGLYGNEGEAETRRLLETLIKGANENSRPRVREIIKQLFPAIGWVFGGPRYSAGIHEEWLRDLRVGHPDTFDRYFNLVIPHGDISQAEVDRLLAHADDRENTVAQLLSLSARNLLATALERLEAYKERIPLEHSIPFVTSLFDIGDELPKAGGGMFEIEPAMHAIRIVHWHLKRLNNPHEQARILGEAIRATTGLYLPVRQVSLEEGTKDPEDRLVDDADLPQLQALCLAKLRDAAGQGTLQRNSEMARLLYSWSAWAGVNEPKQWVEGLLASDDGVLAFLRAFIIPVGALGLGDYTSQRVWHVRLSDLEQLASLDHISQVISSIDKDKLIDKDRQSIAAFSAAMRRRREGLGEDDLKYDEAG